MDFEEPQDIINGLEVAARFLRHRDIDATKGALDQLVSTTHLPMEALVGYMCQYEQIDLLHFIFENSSLDINMIILEENNHSLLTISASTDQPKVTAALIKLGANVDHAIIDGQTALFIAASNGYEEIVDLLLAAKADPNLGPNESSALGMSIFNGFHSVARKLLSAGADARKQLCLLTAVAREYNDMIELLLAHNANVEETDERINTPLIIAAESGNLAAVKMLLAKGANVNATNFDNTTPLFSAIHGEHLEIAKLLLESGANPNIANHAYMTPLHTMVVRNNIPGVELLLSYKASPNTSLAVGETPLWTAARQGFNYVAYELLMAGANPNAANIDSWTPLMIATFTQNYELAFTLLQFKADPNIAKNDDGTTPIFYSMLDKNEELTQKLMEAGARLDIKNLKGQTPAEFVAAGGQ